MTTPSAPRRPVLPGRDERGSATTFVIGMAITLLACAGLVLDGGTALNARMRLADQVEQSARAGAQQVDEPTLRATGTMRLDRHAAQDSARGYLARVGQHDANVSVSGDAVTVTARDSVDTVLLNLVGFHRFSIEASATAEAETR